MREILFTKIEFKDYDLFIPFVCKGCGTCCRTYTPMITPDNLVVLAAYLKIPEKELLEDYDNCYRKNLVRRSVPCCFLTEENRCAIYLHPLRTDTCRLYPFSFGKPAIPIADCPGHDEHTRIVEGFLAGEKDYELYDSSFCPEQSCRPPPRPLWPWLRLALRTARPSRLVVRYFTKMNGLPGNFLKQGKTTPLSIPPEAGISP